MLSFQCDLEWLEGVDAPSLEPGWTFAACKAGRWYRAWTVKGVPCDFPGHTASASLAGKSSHSRRPQSPAGSWAPCPEATTLCRSHSQQQRTDAGVNEPQVIPAPASTTPGQGEVRSQRSALSLLPSQASSASPCTAGVRKALSSLASGPLSGAHREEVGGHGG